jgi:3-demethoxyubiquinol 3-hydroxylase
MHCLRKRQAGQNKVPFPGVVTGNLSQSNNIYRPCVASKRQPTGSGGSKREKVHKTAWSLKKAHSARKHAKLGSPIPVKPLWSSMRQISKLDQLLSLVTRLPGQLNTSSQSERPKNRPDQQHALSDQDKQKSGALMRVNHVGEVCAQALYEAQALVTSNKTLSAQLRQAANDERRHLEWLQVRLGELEARPSLLNPLWFTGAFSLGLLAGWAGDATSLGFVAETEKQVEAHLESHLTLLPANDQVSRDLVSQIRAEEAEHGLWAQQAGGTPLPWPIPQGMRACSKVMTGLAYYV